MATTHPEHLADVRTLLARIDALEGLLVHYRIGKPPSERLHEKLAYTKAGTAAIRERMLVDEEA